MQVDVYSHCAAAVFVLLEKDGVLSTEDGRFKFLLHLLVPDNVYT